MKLDEISLDRIADILPGVENNIREGNVFYLFIACQIRFEAESLFITTDTHGVLDYFRSAIGDADPHFELFEEKPQVKIDHTPQKELRYSSGPLELSIDISPNNLAFAYTNPLPSTSASKYLTGHSRRSIGFVSSRDTPTYSVSGEDEMCSHVLREAARRKMA